MLIDAESLVSGSVSEVSLGEQYYLQRRKYEKIAARAYLFIGIGNHLPILIVYFIKGTRGSIECKSRSRKLRSKYEIHSA
jgi:hypothetical protein